jgi:PAS domain S-box-containing protein
MSIRTRLVLLVFLASVLALVCVGALVVLYEATSFRPRAVAQWEAQARTLDVVLRPTLDFLDPDSAERYLTTWREANPEISTAALLGSDDSPFALSQRTPATDAAPRIPQPDGAAFTRTGLALWRTIRRGNETLGHVYLLVDVPPLYARLPQYGIMSAAVVLAILVVGVALLGGLRRNVLGPLAELVTVTGRIAREGDYNVRAPEGRGDELDQLAHSFNRMVEAVGQRDADLRAAARHVQGIFAAATDVAIIATDPAGTVTVFNAGSERMLGYAAPDIVGRRRLTDFLLEADIAECVEEQSRLEQRHVEGFDAVVAPARRGERDARPWMFVGNEGKRVPVHLVVTAVRVAEDQVTGFLAIAVDLTERERMEENLRESEERMRRLASAAFEGLVFTEGDVVLEVNDQAAQMFGFEPSELVGRNVLDLVAPESRAVVEDNIQSSFEGTVEAWGLKRDGSRFLVESRARRLFDKGRQTRVLALRDVTERRLAEEARARLEDQLTQSQKLEAVGRLAGGVAHDFNNMLSVILGHAELVLEQIEPTDPMHQDVKQIQQAGRHSADLTRQLLAFARKQTVSPKVLDLNATVAGMLRMLQRLIGEDITLTWTPGANLWPIRMDPAQVDQILANLSVNARDAISGVGSLAISSANVALEASQQKHAYAVPGDYVVLSVKDNGCGMSKDVAEHLFEPFFTTKGVGGGTGLGLATVFGIVKQNEGFIDVDSQQGSGSTFSIYLPRYKGAIVESRPAEPGGVPRGSGETLLLVEDDAAILNLGQSMLRRLGYNVLTAATPDDALRLCESHDGEIQLLITDVVMPQMNGRQLAEEMAMRRPGLKCLFVSGYTADVIAHRGVLEVGVHFLQKPFSIQDLASKVRELLTASTSG